MQEIDDNNLIEHKYIPINNYEQIEIDKISLSCYLNLALLYQKLKQWSNSILACNYAIDIDDKCIKAYFRRAQVTLLS